MSGKRSVYITVALALAAVLLVGVNVVSNSLLRTARVDLTADKLYTLSAGTETILGELEEPILIRFFYSRDLANDYPTVRDYAKRVREILEEYVIASDGMITLESIDPVPFSNAEDEAMSLGVQGIPLPQTGERLYFGMVATNTIDEAETVPFFQEEREPYLEYDLIRAIYRLSGTRRPVVGLISALQINGGVAPSPGGGRPVQIEPWAIAQQIGQLFELRNLGVTAPVIDDDVDVLMVVHPRELLRTTLYAIEQFILAGGPTLIMVDPYSEIARATAAEPNPLDTQNSNLQEFFQAWGIELAPGMVVADLAGARRVMVGGAAAQQVVPYVVWLGMGAENLNADEVIASGLGRVNFASAGSLRPLDDAVTTFTPLVTTSADSMLIERYHIQFQPNPVTLLEQFAATGERYHVAARVGGMVKSVFQGRPGAEEDAGEADEPPSEAAEEEEQQAPHIAESVAPINVLVIADTDFMVDNSWAEVQRVAGGAIIRPHADNASFVVNALELFSSGSDLIGLRSRGRTERGFDVVEALRLDAEKRFREEEEILNARLQDLEAKLLAESQSTGAGDAPVLSDSQIEAFKLYQAQMLDTRKQLREVRHALNADIESLGKWLKFANVGAVPLLATLVAVVVLVGRLRRRRRAAGRV